MGGEALLVTAADCAVTATVLSPPPTVLPADLGAGLGTAGHGWAMVCYMVALWLHCGAPRYADYQWPTVAPWEWPTVAPCAACSHMYPGLPAATRAVTSYHSAHVQCLASKRLYVVLSLQGISRSLVTSWVQ